MEETTVWAVPLTGAIAALFLWLLQEMTKRWWAKQDRAPIQSAELATSSTLGWQALLDAQQAYTARVEEALARSEAAEEQLREDLNQLREELLSALLVQERLRDEVADLTRRLEAAT